jgi:hypothetical protein
VNQHVSWSIFVLNAPNDPLAQNLTYIWQIQAFTFSPIWPDLWPNDMIYMTPHNVHTLDSRYNGKLAVTDNNAITDFLSEIR